MKRILIILFIIIECCYLNNISAFIKKVEFNLKPNELIVVFLNNNVLFLKTLEADYLINLDVGNESEIKNKINYFSNRIDYLVGYKKINIKYQQFYSLNKKIEIDNINLLSNNNNLQLKYNNQTLCFLYNNNYNFNRCDYIYINDYQIKIKTTPKLLLYSFLNDEFLEEMYDKWMDSYYIDKHSYTALKIGNSYDILNIPQK